MNYKTYDNLSIDIQKNLYKIHELDIDLVVGIPRSGMIPAYMIALALNVHCIDLKSFLENRELKNGKTRKLRNKSNENFPHNYNKILIVDDTIDTGNSLKEEMSLIPEHLKSIITTCAIYSSKEKRDDIDIFLEYLKPPRIFQWNIYHHGILKDSCVDIDGVLCIDPNEEENDDGEKYIEFMLNAKPNLLLSGEIHSLVTNRLEKYRPQTELWLKKHNIKYKNLIMLNLPSKEERIRTNANFTHKANYYKNNDLSFFIESDINQAKVIKEKTGKAVYCVDENIMIELGSLKMLSKNPKFFLKSKIKDLLRPLYHMVKQNSK